MRAVALVLFLMFASFKPAITSIQIFGDIHEDGAFHQLCTAWATKVHDHTRWVTASHCISPGHEENRTTAMRWAIAGKPAEILKLDPIHDLALLTGPVAQGFLIAFGEPSLGDDVYSFGYFWESGVLTKGITSTWAGDKRIFATTGGPGSSGAPLFTRDNIVVGVVQQGPPGCVIPCSVLKSATVKELRAFLYDE